MIDASMATPLDLNLTSSPCIRVAPERLERLVRAGFGTVAADDVEVRLKPAPATLRRWVQLCRDPHGCGRATNYEQDGRVGHCAVSHKGVTALASDLGAHDPARPVDVVAPYPYTGRVRDRHRRGTVSGRRFLVSLQMPANPQAAGPYPRTSRDPRRADAPTLRIGDWTEDLVRLAAHEACHVHQHRIGVPRSELDAEQWAAARLHAHRRRRLAAAPASPWPSQDTPGVSPALPGDPR